MGCGCKNKGNQPAQSNQTPSTPLQQKMLKQKAVNENVKEVIRKTVEKYYNKNKS